MSTRNSSVLTKKYKLILSAVHMVYRLVNSTFETKELLLRLTRLVCQLIDASASSVYLVDPQKKKIKLVAAFNNRINVLLEKKGDIERLPPEQKEVAFGATIFRKRLIGIPLVSDDNLGAIFIRRKNTEETFSMFDKELLSVIAEQAVTAIKNLQLHEEQQKIILGSIESIGKLLQTKGYAIGTHTPVYLKIIEALAEKLQMAHNQRQCLQYAGMLHDAGCMNVPYEILLKKSRLSAEEFKIIRDHPMDSVALIKPVEFLKPVLPIILYHHEKYDGTGYPSGLKKEQIPLGARVMAVVDAFEAMIQGRPYRKTFPVTQALEELKKNSGTQFDPRIINAFLELSRQKKFRKYLSLIK